jgi:hypothetical protein
VHDYVSDCSKLRAQICLFNHLIGAGEQRMRDRDAEGFRRWPLFTALWRGASQQEKRLYRSGSLSAAMDEALEQWID